MLALTTWALATAVALTAPPPQDVSRQLDVDCRSRNALERALAKAKRLGGADITLHGVCEGHFVIDSDGVALRGATPESGLAAPAGSSYPYAVLEVVNVSAYLNGLTIGGGVLGVFAHGWDADVVLYNVDVHGQANAGVVADQGAFVGLLDSTVRDGAVGVAAWSSGVINLQHVIVDNRTIGVGLSGNGEGALSDTTITNSREVGLFADSRSGVNVLGCTFRDNGQAHIASARWSGVNLSSEAILGSPSDTTLYAFAVYDQSTLNSFVSPDVHGDVGVSNGSSIRMGSAVLHGDLFVGLFSDAYVRNGEITGHVFCSDGADAICQGATSAGVSQCPSPTCGPVTPEADARARSIPELPTITMPRLERRSRSSPRR